MQLKIIRIISLIAALLAGLWTINADAAGIGYRDIFVGASARAVGMGSAFTAGPSTNNAFLWNPSSLGFMDGFELAFGGVPVSGSTSGRDGAFSVAASPNALGITEKNVGGLSIASWLDGWNTPNTGTDVTQIVLLGYGRAISEQVSAGANIRYSQNIDTIRTKYLWSADLGMQLAYPLEKWDDTFTMGLSLTELSSGIWVDGEIIEPAPIAARFGMTYALGSETLFSADFAHYVQNQLDRTERFRLHLGAERWLFNGHFGLRTGYTALTAAEQFQNGEWSGGVSLRNDYGQLDYAYVTGNELEQNLHWVSATVRWGDRNAASANVNHKNHKKSSTSRDTQPRVTMSPILMPKTLETESSVEKARDLVASEVGLQASELTISPNNDGIADSTAFRFEVGENDAWTLTIRDEYTEAVWEQSGNGSPPPEGIVWNGTANTGKLVIAGTYEARLSVGDAQNVSRQKIIVNLGPPTTKTKTVASPRAISRQKITVAPGPPPTKTETATSPMWCLMVGSFASQNNAESLAAELRRLHPGERVSVYAVSINEQTMHRVTIGAFAERAEAAALTQQIRETQRVDAVLIALQ